MFRIMIAFAAAATLAACSWTPVRGIQTSFSSLFKRNGEPALATGIQKYDNGEYSDAAKNLQTALELGLTDPDRVRAHKYLAFIHCASGRESRCREEFRLALAIDPHMQLAPAEAGHPIWGPVFRSVKAGH